MNTKEPAYSKEFNDFFNKNNDNVQILVQNFKNERGKSNSFANLWFLGTYSHLNSFLFLQEKNLAFCKNITSGLWWMIDWLLFTSVLSLLTVLIEPYKWQILAKIWYLKQGFRISIHLIRTGRIQHFSWIPVPIRIRVLMGKSFAAEKN